MRDEVDVRDLLEGAARLDRADALDPGDAEAHWTQGRRRRRTKRIGAGAVTGVAGLAVAGLVWQTGFLGGSGAGQDDLVAAFPEGTTTFVFAAPDAPDDAVPELSGVTVPSEEALAGTRWQLLDEVWGGGEAASVVGSASDTELSFPASGPGWGITVEDCGGAGRQEELDLAEDGAFGTGDVGTDDQGCPEEVQAAEDFWMDVLAGDGSLRMLGGDSYLLLTVPVAGTADDPVAITDEATVVVSEDASAQTGAEEATAPSTDAPVAGTEPTGPSASEEPTEEPTSPEPTAPESTDPGGDGSGEATDDPTGTPGGTPGPSGEPGGDRAWTPPGETAEGGEGLAAGAQLLAPTVRAGRHDGFDRVVVDLTGTGTPGWRGGYVDVAIEAGSGTPIAVAGDSLLRVQLDGMAYPEPGDPVYDSGIFGLDTHSLGAVVEVMRTTPYEGQLQLLIGMTGEPKAYQVFVLQDPLRLVVDVQTS